MVTHTTPSALWRTLERYHWLRRYRHQCEEFTCFLYIRWLIWRVRMMASTSSLLVGQIVVSTCGASTQSTSGLQYSITSTSWGGIFWTAPVIIRALEASSLLGGENLQPFYAMLDGGRDGEFFNELEEYFYYAQIRRQGEITYPKHPLRYYFCIEFIAKVRM